MDFVEPIRDRKKISQIRNQLEGAKRYRDLLLFVTGINTVLRISDLLPLQVGDFINTDGASQGYYSIRVEKREKRNVIVINTSIRDALEKYRLAYPTALADPAYFIFFSRACLQTRSSTLTAARSWAVT